jgi:hypothetical protein
LNPHGSYPASTSIETDRGNHCLFKNGRAQKTAVSSELISRCGPGAQNDDEADFALAVAEHSALAVVSELLASWPQRSVTLTADAVIEVDPADTEAGHG